MTETELSHLHQELQNLLHKQNYTDLFKRLAKHDFFKGFATYQLEFTGGSYKTDTFFSQRFEVFIDKAISEEREKLNVQLDEAILKKEQENARLDKEISEKKKNLEALNQQIAQAKTELASSPASPTVTPDKEAEAKIWFDRAEVLPNKEDKILAYDKAIACKPDFAEAYLKRGIAKSELHKYQEGLADFTQVILLSPNRKNVYSFRGWIKQKLKMYQEAVADYEQQKFLSPDDDYSVIRIAECYSMLQDKPNTLKYLAEVIKLRPDYKQESKQNEAFQWLWEDADFKRLVA